MSILSRHTAETRQGNSWQTPHRQNALRALFAKARRDHPNLTFDQILWFYDLKQLSCFSPAHEGTHVFAVNTTLIPYQTASSIGRRFSPGDPQSDSDAPMGRKSYSARTTGVTATTEATTSVKPSSDDILDCLRKSPYDPKAVFDAELADFRPDQEAELLILLRRFIDHHRRTHTPATVVAVGAAVRKYIADLPPNDLEMVGGVLDSDATDLPLPLETEVAKMVVRKLCAAPPSEPKQYPGLCARLADLANAYLHPRLLRRPHLGATTLNAILAVAIIGGDAWPTLAKKLHELADAGFRKHVARRGGAILAAVEKTYPTAWIDGLQQLVDDK